MYKNSSQKQQKNDIKKDFFLEFRDLIKIDQKNLKLLKKNLIFNMQYKNI